MRVDQLQPMSIQHAMGGELWPISRGSKELGKSRTSLNRGQFIPLQGNVLCLLG